MSNKFLKGVELNEGKDQGYFIPNLTGTEDPTDPTVKIEGAVGSQYMNTETDKIYICTAASDGVYTWELFKGEGGSTENAVLYTEQTLTEVQKAQARANIGAAAVGEGGGSAEGAVLYTKQTLDSDQKAQARANIGAVTLNEVLEALPIYNGEVEEV